MNIINRISENHNVYKFTYMGECCINYNGRAIKFNDEIVVKNNELPLFLSSVPTEERDCLIYNKVFS